MKGVTLPALAAAAAAVTPVASSSQSSSQRGARCHVPVPVYCEPLTTTDSTMKVRRCILMYCTCNYLLLLLLLLPLLLGFPEMTPD